MSFCKNCVTGVQHTGDPQGEIVKIGGVECYVATPTADYPKHKVVLFLPDAFGHVFVNAQLLADGFASNGFKVVIPDYLNGDPIPVDALSGNTGFDLQAWLKTHGQSDARPPLDKVVAGLREQGVTDLGATGYCLGGRYVFDLAFDNVIKAAVVAHPSFLQIPSDLEKYAVTSSAPLLINACEVDSQFPAEAQEHAKRIFGKDEAESGAKFPPGFRMEYWPGCTHGFAVRGDMDDPQVKAGKEGAFKSSVEWFFKYL